MFCDWFYTLKSQSYRLVDNCFGLLWCLSVVLRSTKSLVCSGCLPLLFKWRVTSFAWHRVAGQESWELKTKEICRSGHARSTKSPSSFPLLPLFLMQSREPTGRLWQMKVGGSSALFLKPSAALRLANPKRGSPVGFKFSAVRLKSWMGNQSFSLANIFKQMNGARSDAKRSAVREQSKRKQKTVTCVIRFFSSSNSSSLDELWILNNGSSLMVVWFFASSFGWKRLKRISKEENYKSYSIMLSKETR